MRLNCVFPGRHFIVWGNIFCLHAFYSTTIFSTSNCGITWYPAWQTMSSFWGHLWVYPCPQPILSKHLAIKWWCGDKYTIKERYVCAANKRSMSVRHDWKLIGRILFNSGNCESEKPENTWSIWSNIQLLMLNLTFECIIKIQKAKDHIVGFI